MKIEKIQRWFIFKVGKKEWFKVDLAQLISQATGKSISEVKKLLSQKAIDMWVETNHLDKQIDK